MEYLEDGTGPLAAELNRLWRAKGPGQVALPGNGRGHGNDGWRLACAAVSSSAGATPPSR